MSHTMYMQVYIMVRKTATKLTKPKAYGALVLRWRSIVPKRANLSYVHDSHV